MIVKQLALGSMENFSYIMGDEQTKECAVVDPGWEIPTILAEAKEAGFIIKKVFITHSHYDHVKALGELMKSIQDAEIVIHEQEPFDASHYGTVTQVKDGDVVDLGSLKIEVLHTPGHTPGSMCLLVEGKLFTGDTLFVEGCGRVDFAGGSADDMWTTLQRLKKLDESVQVHPGHNYGSVPISTIKHEKEKNRFMMCETKEDFLKERLG